MMTNLSENDRRALRFGGIGLAGIAALMLVIMPVMDYWDGLSKRERDGLRRLQGIQQALGDQLAVQSSMTQLRETARIYPDRVALNQQTAMMLRQVESLPAYSGITVRRTDGMPLRDEEGFFRSAVSVQFGGTLQGVHRFLQEVDGARPSLKVERLTITADQNGGDRIDGSMVISGYALVAAEGKKG
jgi:hypothetical protein